MDDLVAWGERQPRNPETRAELLRRIAELVRGPAQDIIRFGQSNEAAMRGHELGDALRTRLFAVVGLVVDPGAGLKDQLRSVLALAAVYLLNVPELPAALGPVATASMGDRSRAAMEVALELIGSQGA